MLSQFCIYLLHGAESFLRSYPVFAASQEIPRTFMEPEGSLPYSQVPATCPYPEPTPSIPPSNFLKIHFNIILPSSSASTGKHKCASWSCLCVANVVGMLFCFWRRVVFYPTVLYCWQLRVGQQYKRNALLLLYCSTAISCYTYVAYYRVIKKSLHTWLLQYQKQAKIFLKVSITYHNNAVSILNTVFENTVRRVNKCLQTGGRHF
jgi:hypothetical protein